MSLIINFPITDWLANWEYIAVVIGASGISFCIGWIVSETRTMFWKLGYRQKVKAQLIYRLLRNG